MSSGPNTHERTVHWQSQYVPGDFSGKVGPNTWGAASRKIFDKFQCPGDGFCYYYYVGSEHGLDIRQDSNGYWQFVNPRTGAWTNTDH